MDVLHVIHQFAPETRGGSESYVLDVARAQRLRGLTVGVLTGSMAAWPQVGVETLEVEGLPVWRLHRDDFFFDHHAKLWHAGVDEAYGRLLRELRPKLVHVHHWVRLSCHLVQQAEALGIPTVVTLHDQYTSCPRAFRMRPDDPACSRVLGGASCGPCVPKYGHETEGELALGVELFAASLRAELSAARAVLVGVDTTADLLSRFSSVPRARYTTLPLGYRPRWPGLPRLAAPAPGEPMRLAYWGGVGRHKGLGVLVDAVRMLQDDATLRGRFALHVLGGFESAEFEAELRERAAGLPVTFHGPFTPAQLRAAAPHVGVFPSTCMETWGIVLDECAELGLPAVVSNLGALPGRVEPRGANAWGLVSEGGNASSLAHQLRRIVSEPGLWERLQQAVPAATFVLDQHVEALQGIYHRANLAGPMGFAPPVPLAERLRFLRVQQDSAHTKLLPPGGPR